MLRSGEQWVAKELAHTKLAISTFGEDEAGELYVADYDGGGIYHLELGSAGL